MLAALDTLTASIGVHGILNTRPLSIHWGNGVALRDHTGKLITAGYENVARWIAQHMKAGYQARSQPK